MVLVKLSKTESKFQTASDSTHNDTKVASKIVGHLQNNNFSNFNWTAAI